MQPRLDVDFGKTLHSLGLIIIIQKIINRKEERKRRAERKKKFREMVEQGLIDPPYEEGTVRNTSLFSVKVS